MYRIGDKVRRLRDRAGMTQEQLAALIGTNQAGVSRIELTHVGLSNKVLVRLADVFGISFDELVREDMPLHIVEGETA